MRRRRGGCTAIRHPLPVVNAWQGLAAAQRGRDLPVRIFTGARRHPAPRRGQWAACSAVPRAGIGLRMPTPALSPARSAGTCPRTAWPSCGARGVHTGGPGRVAATWCVHGACRGGRGRVPPPTPSFCPHPATCPPLRPAARGGPAHNLGKALGDSIVAAASTSEKSSCLTACARLCTWVAKGRGEGCQGGWFGAAGSGRRRVGAPCGMVAVGGLVRCGSCTRPPHTGAATHRHAVHVDAANQEHDGRADKVVVALALLQLLGREAPRQWRRNRQQGEAG